MNSVASGQSFGSAISVVSAEEGGRVDIVGGQYHAPVSQEQVVHLAQQGIRQGKRNSKNISPLEQDKGGKRNARVGEAIQDYESYAPRQIEKAPVFSQELSILGDVLAPGHQPKLPE